MTKLQSLSTQTGSLARETLLKMAVRIALVVISVTLISYWHVTSTLETQVVEQLKKYIVERGKRESELFRLAEDNHALFKTDMLQRLTQMADEDPQARFNQLFKRWADGTTRNNFEGKPSQSFDTQTQATVFIGPQAKIDADLQRRVLVGYDMALSYGPAWRNRFVDTYIMMPENVEVIYWPEVPWGIEVAGDFVIPEQEFFYISDKVHNPQRESAWTPLFLDPVPKLWMVSVETPIDDAQGRHIATIGHDIILDKLFESLINDHLSGTYNMLFRADGRLIVHPDLMPQIQVKEGQFDITDAADPALKHIFELVTQNSANEPVLEDKTYNQYLAITKIDGPDWYLVTVYPKSLLTQLAFETARFIFLLGLISLLIEVTILYIVLRQQVTNPLQTLMTATSQVAQGNFSINLDLKQSNELGHLARLFQHMATQLAETFGNLEQLVAKRTKQLQHANEELARTNADKDRFFSILAHDLKSPFMPLLGNAELLTEMGDALPPAEVKSVGASIYRTGRNVLGLLESVLTWARLEMGRMEYLPQRLDLHVTAAKSVELLVANATMKQIELRNEIKPETWIYADENMLDTVIRNLTNNALKFTLPGGQVTISAAESGDNFVKVSVADTGVGMSQETQEKLFKLDQKMTTLGTAKETGTGLGLIICQEMVLKSGGRIWVESELGRGTTVKFTVQISTREAVF